MQVKINNSKWAVAVFVAMVIIGAGLIIWGVYGIFDSMHFKRICEKTTGIVIDYDEVKRKKNGNDSVRYKYFPTYEYEVDGQVYTVSASKGSMFVPDIGDEGVVYYNPDNPSVARTELGIKYDVAYGFSGVLMFCFGAVFLYFRWKNRD